MGFNDDGLSAAMALSRANDMARQTQNRAATLEARVEDLEALVKYLMRRDTEHAPRDANINQRKKPTTP